MSTRRAALVSALLIAATLAFVPAGSITPAFAGGDPFDTHWHDGKAELNGYRLTVSRYGQERDGTAVLVYVTEPFSESKRVKVNDPGENPSDTFDALKLNLIRDFQTGIYDYNTMTSLFVHSDDFSPAKISFSSAEWCGHVYDELRFEDARITEQYFSYFENESGWREIDTAKDGIVEDNLFVLLRGLRGDYLDKGNKKVVRLLPSVYFGRLTHKAPQWVSAEIRREKKMKRVKVPAGKFETMVYRVNTSNGREGTFYVEAAYPHRIVRWEMLPDVRAELAGSARLAYWRLNRNGNESYLKKLGL